MLDDTGSYEEALTNEGGHSATCLIWIFITL